MLWIHLVIFAPFTIHIVIKHRVVVLELGFVGAYTPDNGVLNLLPLASDVGWFVGVARASDVVRWVGHHLEVLTVLFHV